MKVRVEAWHLPPRLLTGMYFLNTGLSKAGADEATAAQLHGFASGTYPFLRKLDARRFTACYLRRRPPSVLLWCCQ
jgi:hypothetical protein